MLSRSTAQVDASRALPFLFVLSIFGVMAPGLFAQEESDDAPTKTEEAAPPATKPGEPFLWIVEPKEEGGAASYLFGTIHLPDDRVLDLPEVVTQAVDNSTALYTELPLDMGSQLAMQTMLFLPEGKTLKDIVPEELYARTDAFFTSKGIPLAMLGNMKIWAVFSNMSILDYMAEMMTKQALDPHLYTMAQKAGKTVGGLETPEEQVNAMDSMTIEEQLSLLEKTLDQMDEAATEDKNPIEALVEAYLTGDEKVMLEVAMEDYDQDDPIMIKLMTALVHDRNVRMADRIAAHIEGEPKGTFFFAVGAMHFPGDDGIVALLVERGYEVRRLSRADADQLPTPPVLEKKPEAPAPVEEEAEETEETPVESK